MLYTNMNNTCYSNLKCNARNSSFNRKERQRINSAKLLNWMEIRTTQMTNTQLHSGRNKISELIWNCSKNLKIVVRLAGRSSNVGRTHIKAIFFMRILMHFDWLNTSIIINEIDDRHRENWFNQKTFFYLFLLFFFMKNIFTYNWTAGRWIEQGVIHH